MNVKCPHFIQIILQGDEAEQCIHDEIQSLHAGSHTWRERETPQAQSAHDQHAWIHRAVTVLNIHSQTSAETNSEWYENGIVRVQRNCLRTQNKNKLTSKSSCYAWETRVGRRGQDGRGARARYSVILGFFSVKLQTSHDAQKSSQTFVDVFRVLLIQA